MPITKDDFITSAKTIMRGSPLNEIDYRNAVSRAYYAAFHEASRISDKYSKGNFGNRKGTHEKVIHKLQTHPTITSTDQVINEIGNLLQMCKKQRVRADYNLNAHFHKTNTDTTLQICDQILLITANFP